MADKWCSSDRETLAGPLRKSQATSAKIEHSNAGTSNFVSKRILDFLAVDGHTVAFTSHDPTLPKPQTNPPENTAAAAWEALPPQAQRTCRADQLLI